MTDRHGATLPLISRLACGALALLVAAGWTHAARSDDLPDRCAVPLSWDLTAPDSAAFWRDDRNISILRRADGERVAYRIVGDVVELNPILFPALATAPGGGLADVSEIVIDAREIILDMPIRLTDGALRLRADTVRFAGGGAISLIDPPKAAEQAVEIIARTLDLSKARAVPFAFATQGWQLGTPPQWPAAEGAKRMLRLKVGEILAGDSEGDASREQLRRDPLRWVHNHTADQGFDSGLPKDVWSAGYDIVVGADGAQAYSELLAGTLLWPDMVANKLLRLRSRAPFDPQVAQFLRTEITGFLPRLDGRASRQSAAMLRKILRQLDDRVDPFGGGMFDVPMSDLAERVTAFRKSLDEVFGTEKKAGTLQMWDESRIASIVASRPANTAKQLEQVDRSLRSLAGERTAAAQRMTRNIDQLLQLVQATQSKMAEVAVLDHDLRVEYESRKSAAESYGGAVGSLSSIPVPVNFGFMPAAPGALGTSAIRATGPAFYYGAKDGSWPMAVPASMKDVADRYTGYAAALGDLGTAWTAAEALAGAAIADYTGKQRNQEELTAYDAAMRDVLAAGHRLRDMVKYGPAELKLRLDSFDLLGPEKNEKRFTLLSEAEAIAANAGAIQAEIQADLVHIHAVDADLAELGAIRADLQGLRAMPAIEAVQRQTMIDASMRGALLAEMARQAVLLRKGFYYVTGEWPNLAEDVLHFADDVATADHFDDDHRDQFDPVALEQALAQSRADTAAYYRAFAERRVKQLAAFAEAKPATPKVELFRAAYVDDSGRDLEAAFLRRQFLNAINRALAAQVELGRIGAGFADRPILVPIQITPPSTSEGAQLLLGVAVTKVRFRDEANLPGAVTLRIEHPRWGNVQIGGDCRRVIDVTQDGRNPGGGDGYVQIIALPRDVKANWAEAVSPETPFSDVLKKAFPIDAPYFAYVQLAQPSAWRRPPVIDEIEISFIKIGTAAP
jgi:hypothetical protein